ncbi:ABC transporter ATP-binding protein [Leadbettera azotonutricia]|uniref:Lipid A export ATP-binding/permease protein MsbA n=1 Tax=Leadbettera azotonutricia (strain ATCC BAA-888 / DSM 13862 / ZAS-9) TaxID=545695 RepID=F5Y9V7_LEAAZ|nr:ABC transporter ATP-binding protein [Leadbettera azotonutricia]AEF80327.1 lipid A export ATP-binding/permease protein MsbA [Leadbettera azotonutricia ZAS-9]
MADYEDFDYNKPMSLSIWKKMLPFILPQKKYLVRCASLMLCAAAIDVVLPLLLGYAIKHNIEPRSAQGAWKLIAVAIILPLVQGFIVRFFVAFGIRAEVGISRALRNSVFFHLQKLSLSYYNKTPVGYMMARTNSDTGRIGDLVAWGLIDFSWSAFYCVGVVISMFMVHWQLALIVCATIPPLALLTAIFQKKILKVNRIVRKLNSKMTGAMNEGITGARTVKVLVTEKQSLGEYMGITGDYRRHANHLASLRSIFIPLVLFIGSLATAIVLGYGGYEIVFLGADLSILAIFLQYAGGFFDPIQNIANILTDFVSTQANVERVSGLLEQVPGIIDTPEVIEKYGDTFNPKKENWEPVSGDVEFRDVTFRYPDGTENVLEHFDLQVKAGTYVAIVGETGAGKSTLVNLVCRFFEPTTGAILVDGRDYRERSQIWLHSALGYVLQSPHLFTGTIRDNIRYGRLESSDAEVEVAAKIVHADSVIAKLENGFDTEVGEGGDRLSTGEKQLISFARAVLADPRIFILDEATSSVDTEMEMLLQNAIHHLLEGRTSFVIAHRLSTIRGADIILVVHNGKIIERGTHKELMRAKGHYHDLYTRQFEEEAEEEVLRDHPGI